MTSGPAIDSRAVDKLLRPGFWDRLKEHGFDRRTGRTAWRDGPACVHTVNVQSFNRYLGDVMGTTTFSFSVNLGVFYPAIADISTTGKFVKDRSRPKDQSCQARFHLTKGLTQPEQWSSPPPVPIAWKDRPDVWFVRPDGSNVDEVVADALARVIEDGLPWLERLSDINEARRTFFEEKNTYSAPGVLEQHYGGTLGSANRWQSICGLSLVLRDADGVDQALREMEMLSYFRDRPLELDEIRASAARLDR